MNNRTRGYKAKKNGDGFESKIKFSANKLGWECIQIPTGAKRFRNKIFLVKSPFDFILVKNTKSLFFDAKSTEDNNFSYSKVNQTQVTNLINIERQGCYAGYVIRYGKDDACYFYSASALRTLQRRSSLERENGLYLGPSSSIHFDLLENANIILSCTRKSAV